MCECIFICKQKTAYEMRIRDWSSDVCSSELEDAPEGVDAAVEALLNPPVEEEVVRTPQAEVAPSSEEAAETDDADGESEPGSQNTEEESDRSEEHTSELQSLMRISYAVFCLKKKTKKRMRIILASLYFIADMMV